MMMMMMKFPILMCAEINGMMVSKSTIADSTCLNRDGLWSSRLV